MTTISSNIVGIGDTTTKVIGFLTQYWYIIAILIGIAIIYFLFIR
jgi:hypothetical protein